MALLAGTATLGVVARALVLLVPLHRPGLRLGPRSGLRGTGLRGTGLRSAGIVAGWSSGSVVVGMVGFLAVTRTATGARTPILLQCVSSGPRSSITCAHASSGAARRSTARHGARR